MKKNRFLNNVEWKNYSSVKKIIRKMKLTLFIVLIPAIQILAGNAYSEGARLNLNMKNSSIEDVLGSIEKQSESYFLYNGKLVDVSQTVDLKMNEVKIDKVLDRLFKGKNIQYQIFWHYYQCAKYAIL